MCLDQSYIWNGTVLIVETENFLMMFIGKDVSQNFSVSTNLTEIRPVPLI